MKKVLAIITATLMMLTVIPSVAFAEEEDQTPVSVSGETTEIMNDGVEVTDEGSGSDEQPVLNNDGDTDNLDNSGTQDNDDPAEIPTDGWYTDENGNKYYYVEGETMKGFFDVDVDTYYFAPDSGILQKNCWIKNGGKDYYVGAAGAVLKYLQTINGKTYYFNSKGERTTGLLTISGSKYYFNPEMKTGIVKIGKAIYKFNSDGKAYTGKGWIDNKKRYANGDGTVANTVKKIGKKYYLFNANDGLIITKKGFVKQSGKTYYISSGVVSRGWKAIGKKAYYFCKGGKYPGSQAKNTTVGYLKIPAKGYLGEAYALGIKKLNKTDWTLRQAYKNSYKIRYQGRWWRQKTAEKYALKGFKKNKGNCYVMASTFYIQAKLLGYNVRQIEGKVNGWHPHSWTQIKQDGKWYVYDPNFRNETGRNGWKIYYGKKGTWRYNRYHVFQE